MKRFSLKTDSQDENKKEYDEHLNDGKTDHDDDNDDSDDYKTKSERIKQKNESDENEQKTKFERNVGQNYFL